MSATLRSLEELRRALLDGYASSMAKGGARNGSGTAPAAFTVTVLSGENLHTKQGKPADAFVVVSGQGTGERLIKTRTVTGEDARW